MTNNEKDLTSMVFSDLTVDHFDHNEGATSFWYCTCSCKGETGFPGFKIVSAHDLIYDNVKSCGCRHYRIFSKLKTIHGDFKTPLWKEYKNMIRRCDKGGSYYGKVTVCDEWKGANTGYINFKKDMGPTYKEGLSLDRINNGPVYCKDECRWLTFKQQQQNKTTNKEVVYKGTKYHSLAALLDQFDFNDKRKESRFVASRMNRGWSLEEAIAIPQLSKTYPKDKYYKDNNIKDKEDLILPTCCPIRFIDKEDK